MTNPRKTFRTCGNKGFHITFPNGCTLSTQFGWGNYCENYNLKENEVLDVFKHMRENDVASNDCEIMMWLENSDRSITDEWSKNGDSVQGHVDINQWLSAFDFCRNYKTGQKDPKP